MLGYKIYFKSIKCRRKQPNKGIIPPKCIDMWCELLVCFGFNTNIPMVKVLSKCQSSGPLLRCCVEALSTRVWQRVFGAVELPHGRDVECFLTALLKKQSWAGLWAYSVSGTNKRGDSSHFTLDKQSEAATNGGRSCRNLKTKMKERQLPRASLGPYQNGWVLCQTMTIISGPCCVKSSKSPPPLFFFLYLLSPMLLAG